MLSSSWVIFIDYYCLITSDTSDILALWARLSQTLKQDLQNGTKLFPAEEETKFRLFPRNKLKVGFQMKNGNRDSGKRSYHRI